MAAWKHATRFKCKEQQDRLSKTTDTASKVAMERGTSVAPEEIDLELHDAQQMNKDLLGELTETLNASGDARPIMEQAIAAAGLI